MAIHNDGDLFPGLTALAIPQDLLNTTLPTSSEVTYWNNRAKRVFWIDYNIDDSFDLVELEKIIFAINMEDMGKPVEERVPIKLYIHSYGGDLEQAFAFCDILMASDTPIYTIATGVAMSSAMLIFLAGHKRFAFKHSSLLIHEGSATLSGTQQQVADAQKNYKAQIDQMKDYVLSRTEIPEKVFKKNRSKDWYLTLDEIVNYKVADIVSSLSEIK